MIVRDVGVTSSVLPMVTGVTLKALLVVLAGLPADPTRILCSSSRSGDELLSQHSLRTECIRGLIMACVDIDRYTKLPLVI